MAMIDYGAIAFKNGKLISTEMFTPMIDMVGWEESEQDTYHDYSADKDEPLRLKGNYFAYIGDSECTVAFYKTSMRIIERINGKFFSEIEYFGNTYYTWTKWEKWLCGGNIKVTKRNGYYVCKWTYNGDKYKVYFGYGVDLKSYKKWHIVNYYRSIPFYIHRLPYNIKNKIYEWKYCR